MITNFKKEGLA